GNAGRPPDRPDRGVLVRLFLGRIQGRVGLRSADPRADLASDGSARPARTGEGVVTAASGLSVDKAAHTLFDWAAIFKDAVLAALIATLLALPLIGLQTYD